jgi:hypothetical protein
MLDGSDLAAIGAPGTDESGRFVPTYTRTDAGLIVPGLARDFHAAPTMSAAFSHAVTVVSHFDDARLGSDMRITEVDLLGVHINDFVAAVTSGTETYYDLNIGGDNYRLFNIPVYISTYPNAWSFALAMPVDEVMEGMRTMIIAVISIALVILAIVAIVAILMSCSIAKPIVNMARTLNDIANGAAILPSACLNLAAGKRSR